MKLQWRIWQPPLTVLVGFHRDVIRWRIWQLVTSRGFEYCLFTLIIINTVALAMKVADCGREIDEQFHICLNAFKHAFNCTC